MFFHYRRLLRFIAPVLLSLLFISVGLHAQQYHFREILLGDNQEYVSSIELSPDKNSLTIFTARGKILFFDLVSQTVTRKIELNGFRWGANMRYSKDGKYLLLMEQFYINWALNDDIPSRAALLDVASGQILIDKRMVHAACLSPDSRSLIILDKNRIVYYNIETGAEQKSFSPDDAAFSFAVTGDGSKIAVARKAKEEDLKEIPTIRNDKKAIKEAVKFRQVVTFYDTENFKKLFNADDIFDIVFSMRLSDDGRKLFLFNAPNIRFRKSGGIRHNGYIQVLNPDNGKTERVSFATNAAEPIYKESNDGKYFSITSREYKITAVNTVCVYDLSSGNMLKTFKNDFRLSENTRIGRASFEYLPDGKSIILGYGNKLASWNFKE